MFRGVVAADVEADELGVFGEGGPGPCGEVLQAGGAGRADGRALGRRVPGRLELRAQGVAHVRGGDHHVDVEAQRGAVGGGEAPQLLDEERQAAGEVELLLAHGARVVDHEDEIEQVAAVEPDKEEFTMWILFLLDPSGIRHAVEVMSNEWSIETIYAKALAATGIPVEDQILKFGGRALKPGKKLTSYGVQHGSEIVIEAREGKAVETRQGKQSTGRRREIKKTKGRQAI